MRSAFTLIELLVVIAIVAVLASMLMPAIGMVRDSARSSQCTSNLRQLGMAESAYSNDNDGYITAGRLLDGSALWWDLTAEYVDDSSRVHLCPSAPITGGIHHYGVQFNLIPDLKRNYSGFRPKVGRTSELRSDGVLIFDASQNVISGNTSFQTTEIGIMWNWYTGGSDDQLTIATPLNQDTATWNLDRYRHSGNHAMNIVWGDLHVSTRGFGEMQKGQFRCRKNGRKQSWEPN